MLLHLELTLKKFYLAHSAPCVVFNSARQVSKCSDGLSMLLNVGAIDDLRLHHSSPDHETGSGSVAWPERADTVRASAGFNAWL
jgi:hypothetical protein